MPWGLAWVISLDASGSAHEQRCGRCCWRGRTLAWRQMSSMSRATASSATPSASPSPWAGVDLGLHHVAPHDAMKQGRCPGCSELLVSMQE